MAANTYRIDPLRKDNYETWKMQAEAVLTKSELWGYTSGTIQTPDDDPEDPNKKAEWLKKDLTARSELILMISPNELKQIKSCTTSKDVWDTLAKNFRSKGPARKATLLKQLILHRMRENDDIREHLNKFTDVVDKLADMEITINDDLLSIMMLYSLPSSFENFRIAIESRDALPTPENLKIKICEESEARKNHDSEQTSEGAFLSKSKQNQQNKKKYSNNKKNNFSKLKCDNCGKNNHDSAHCWSKNKKESTFMANHMCLSTISQKVTDSKVWCLDSGATSHMCSKKEVFDTLDENNDFGNLKLASKSHTTQIVGNGIVKIDIDDKNSVKLPDTLFVPDLSANLLSISKITEKGHSVIFHKDNAIIKNPVGDVVMKAQKSDGLYVVNAQPMDKSSCLKSESCRNVSEEKLGIWHRRMGHMNEHDLKESLKRESVLGLDFAASESLDDCEICIRGKFSRPPFPSREDRRTTTPLEIIHSDVCGPMRQPSHAGARYFVTFVDEFSGYTRVYFLQQKNEVFEKFKEYKAEVETSTGLKVKSLQTDNEKSEYCHKRFDAFLKEQGISRRLACTYSPQQNGRAERKNRSLVDKARCLLIESRLPLSFWAEAIHTANYLCNRSPSRTLDYQTPFERWVGRKPSVRHLHVFGSKAFPLDKNPRRGKFDPKTNVGIFVGYSEISKGYRIWRPQKNKIEVTRDVKIINQIFHDSKDSTPEHTICDSNDTIEVVIPHRIEPRTVQVNESDDEDSTSSSSFYGFSDNESQDGNGSEGESEREGDFLRRSGRDRKPPVWSTNYEMGSHFGMVAGHYIDNSREDLSEWECAIKEEIKAHIINDTWTLVNKNDKMNVIGSKMVLKKKFKPSGELERRKARFVARGFSQRPGTDYLETFAPVAKMNSIRLLLGNAVEEGMRVHHLDVSTAFLNAEIDTSIHMEMPKYLEKYLCDIMIEESEKEDKTVYEKAKKMLKEFGKEGAEKVCHLKKAVYGLKQAGRQWFTKLNAKLLELDFKPSQADPCIFISTKGTDKVIIALYVDDLICFSKSLSAIQKTKSNLMKHFSMRDLGDLKYCLGIEVHQNNGSITLSQTKYIEDLLQNFKMQDSKPVTSPMEAGLKLNVPKPTDKPCDVPYQSLIGSLMYLAIATRPDIAHAISYLSQFNSRFSNEHWIAAKRVLRYLKGTKNLGITYSKTNQPIIGFADADWASCTIDRRSYTGYIFKYAGAAISWESRKQKTVALSTAEAEYMCLTESAKEAIHLKQLAGDIGLDLKSITVYNDNQAAHKLATNPMISSRSKHISIKEHFIRDVVKDGSVKISYCPTEDMDADLLTKPLPGPRFAKLRDRLGLIKRSCSGEGVLDSV